MSDDYQVMFAGGNNCHRRVPFMVSKCAARDIVITSSWSIEYCY